MCEGDDGDGAWKKLQEGWMHIDRRAYHGDGGNEESSCLKNFGSFLFLLLLSSAAGWPGGISGCY